MEMNLLMEVTCEFHLAYSDLDPPCATASGHVADLALQHELGLLPQWRFECGVGGCVDSGTGGEIVSGR